jgi:RNA polymerase sigma-B factor
VDVVFRTWRAGDTGVVRVTGVLDFASAVRLRLTLYRCCDAGVSEIVVDLSRVRLMDASSISVLLAVHGRLANDGGGLVVTGAARLVLDVLEITGAAKELGAYDDVDPSLLKPSGRPVSDAQVHGRWGDDVNDFAARMHRTPDRRERARLRADLIGRCLPMAEKLAARFHGLGEPADDLRQVAALALVMAVDRFDPGPGTDFAAYATPTVVGALKRHFRDRGWAVRPPRQIQEMRLAVNRARADLSQDLTRTPTVADIAERLNTSEHRVVEAVGASAGYRTVSLYAPLGADPEAPTLVDRLGGFDDRYESVVNLESLRPLIAELPERDRAILAMRFRENRTQQEIAERLGVSQMHVSRLLTRILGRLRAGLLSD